MNGRRKKRSKTEIKAPMREEIDNIWFDFCRLHISLENSDDYIATQLSRILKSESRINRHSGRLKEDLGEERYASIIALLKKKIRCAEPATPQKPTPQMDALLKSEHQKEITPIILEVISGRITSKGVYTEVEYDGKACAVVIPGIKHVPTHISCIKTSEGLAIDEFWLYSNHEIFKAGRTYIFKVIASKPNGGGYTISVVDKHHNSQEVISSVQYKSGTQIKCTVNGIQKTKSHTKTLILSNPILYKPAPVEKKIKPKKGSSKKPYVHLIYTPMGNKR